MYINPSHILEQKLVRPADGQPDLVLEGPNNQLQQNGIDLRLAKAYKVVGTMRLMVNKADVEKPDLVELQLDSDGCYIFHPGQQYSLEFMEDATVPSDMAARIIHRSTLNRFSGTVMSAHYDSGFYSQGGCGATFRPQTTTFIEVGARSAQILFQSAESASDYDGQYQGT